MKNYTNGISLCQFSLLVTYNRESNEWIVLVASYQGSSVVGWRWRTAHRSWCPHLLKPAHNPIKTDDIPHHWCLSKHTWLVMGSLFMASDWIKMEDGTIYRIYFTKKTADNKELEQLTWYELSNRKVWNPHLAELEDRERKFAVKNGSVQHRFDGNMTTKGRKLVVISTDTFITNNICGEHSSLHHTHACEQRRTSLVIANSSTPPPPIDDHSQLEDHPAPEKERKINKRWEMRLNGKTEASHGIHCLYSWRRKSTWLSVPGMMMPLIMAWFH